MEKLKYFQDIIKNNRKNTAFRDFLKEVVSWSTVVLYRNNGIISKFPETNRIKSVIPNKEFENSRDDLINHWIDYDFSKNFFDNFSDLLLTINIFDFIVYWAVENVFFSDMTLNSRNVYLWFTIINNCENIFYSFSVKDNFKDVFHSVSVYQNSSVVFSSSWVNESYKIFYSRFINNSNNIWFSSNLTGCSECLFCNDLVNCSYYIENIKYEKEEYLQKKEELLRDKHKYLDYYKTVQKVWKNYNSTNVVWSGFHNSIDVKNWYYWYNVKNGNNLIFVWWINGNENMYDIITAWAPKASDLYWIMWANGENLYICMNVTNSSNIYYSYFVTDCSYCIWCIWIKNRSYCIFNKQYTKEQWDELADKILSSMENDWSLWKFFPWRINPFYFNDTMAWLLWNFKKEEVENDWFMWRNEEVKVDIPEWFNVIEITPPARASLPPQLRGTEGEFVSNYQWYDSNWNWHINPEIQNVVIKWEKWNYYRIVKMEYEFLMKYGLPIPEIHWMDRMKLNFWI